MEIENLLKELFVEKENFNLIQFVLRISFAFLLAFFISIVSVLTSHTKIQKSQIHSYILGTIIFAIMINVLGKNLALAIGIFGSLSFIQFRTTMRDPKDTTLFFYSIIMGVSAGSGNYLLTLYSFFIVSITQFILFKIKLSETENFILEIQFRTKQNKLEFEMFLSENKIKSKINYIDELKLNFEYEILIPINQVNSIYEQILQEFSNKISSFKLKKE